jgi:hypothetical protein
MRHVFGSLRSVTFQKLSAREAGLPPTQVLHEGVPDHLEAPLRRWIYGATEAGGGELVAISLKLTVGYTGANAAAHFLEDRTAQELLDVVDAILANGGPWLATGSYDYDGSEFRRNRSLMINVLRRMLEQGSSAFRVNDSATGLIRRVDATATAAFGAATAAASADPNTGSAADQIRYAWAKLYGITPDPPAAYRAAIQAVESAAHSTIEPNNTKATLGTMLGQLRQIPPRFELAIPGPNQAGDIEPLIKIVELLWTGQTSRHGAQTVERPETQDEAGMAVHLAVLLVHWFATGAVHRKP